MAEPIAREQKPLSKEAILDAFCTIRSFFNGRLDHVSNGGKLPTRQTQYYHFSLSNHASKIVTFTGRSKVWIQASAFSQPGPSTPIRAGLQLHLSPPCLMQVKLLVNCFLAPFLYQSLPCRLF